jgi:AcrR family transcriptional regulator
LRARQAEQTRRNVLDAAARLFATVGWASTTLTAVAAEAGTAVETVYSGFASKSGLLTAAIDAALVGDDAPIPLAQRPELKQLAHGSQPERLKAAARVVALAHERSVPLLRALQEAAASDPSCAQRWEKYEADRRIEIRRGLALVAGHQIGATLVDAIWAIASPEVFAKLVLDRGWSRRRYEAWLVAIVTAMLHPDLG